MVSKRLEYNGYKSEYLIGDLPQNKRQQIIQAVKSGRLQYLVATDVAARGLHIDNLKLVVNYDLPEDPENYVHRIGRTGRTGNSGDAATLACEKFVLGLEALESFLDMKIPVSYADEGLFERDASEGMDFRLDRQKPEKHPRKPLPKKMSDTVSGRRRKSSPKGNPGHAQGQETTRAPGKRRWAKTRPGSSDADKLAYYSRKYGEDFKIVNGNRPESTNKNHGAGT